MTKTVNSWSVCPITLEYVRHIMDTQLTSVMGINGHTCFFLSCLSKEFTRSFWLEWTVKSGGRKFRAWTHQKEEVQDERARQRKAERRRHQQQRWATVRKMKCSFPHQMRWWIGRVNSRTFRGPPAFAQECGKGRQNRLPLERRTPSWAGLWTLSYMPSIYGNNIPDRKSVV